MNAEERKIKEKDGIMSQNEMQNKAGVVVSGDSELSFWNAANGKLLKKGKDYGEHSLGAGMISVSNDISSIKKIGGHCFVVGLRDATIRLTEFSVEKNEVTEKRKCVGHSQLESTEYESRNSAVDALDYDMKRQVLVSGNGHKAEVCFWKLSKNEDDISRFHQHKSEMYCSRLCLKFNSSSTLCAFGDICGDISLFDYEKLKLNYVYSGKSVPNHGGGSIDALEFKEKEILFSCRSHYNSASYVDVFDVKAGMDKRIHSFVVRRTELSSVLYLSEKNELVVGEANSATMGSSALHFYDLRKMQERQTIRNAHNRSIQLVSFSNENMLCSTGGEDHIRFWSRQPNDDWKMKFQTENEEENLDIRGLEYLEKDEKLGKQKLNMMDVLDRLEYLKKNLIVEEEKVAVFTICFGSDETKRVVIPTCKIMIDKFL